MVGLIAATLMFQDLNPWTTLWFDRPVTNEASWTEGLPVGNGRLGAIPFGGIGYEAILINEDTIWAKGEVPVQPEDSFEHIQKARELAFAGKAVEAEAEMTKALAPRIAPRSYQPMGWMTVTTRSERKSALPMVRWERNVGNDWRSVEMGSYAVAAEVTETFRSVFQISSTEAEELDTLTLAPIDDRGVVLLNGRKIGETTQWDQSYTFLVKGMLRRGRNELTVEVTNVGGVGHGPSDVRFTSSGAGNGYRRSLDLATGVSRMEYQRTEGKYEQEVIASPVHDVVAVHFKTAEPGGLDCVVGFETKTGEVDYLDDGFVIRGQAKHEDGREGVRYIGVAKIDVRGGRFEEGRISGTSEATVYLAVETDYNKANPASAKAVLQSSPARTAAQAMADGWSAVRAASVRAQTEAFDRCYVHIGSERDAKAKAALPIDQRLKAYQAGEADQGLESLMFAYGRYLLIGSSRPGTMPANLQGIWNPHLEAPWNSDYHTNINLQMNYWPSLVTGLPEFQMPLFDYIEGVAYNDGRRMAKVLGSDGFAIGHTTDAWGWAAMTGQPLWGAWVIGGGWMAEHFMEQYRFTGDEKFLRERAYPFLKGSAEFFLGWLVEDPSTRKLVSGPVTSAENRYLVDGQAVAVSMGPAMDQYVIYENFTNLLEAAEILGIEDEFTARVAEARGKLRMPEIGSDGRLMEWDKEYEEAEPGHRHISHVYGLHPSNQIVPGDQAMFAAIRKSLEHRLANGGGHTGWSRAWIINIWARLLDGEKAYENVQALIQKSVIGALMDNHPPFQIDGNFGFTAGVAEMLVQSHERAENGTVVVRLMPAFPKDWKQMEVKGLRTRAGLILDFKVADGWARGTLTATKADTQFLFAPRDVGLEGIQPMTVRKGESVKFEVRLP